MTGSIGIIVFIFWITAVIFFSIIGKRSKRYTYTIQFFFYLICLMIFQIIYYIAIPCSFYFFLGNEEYKSMKINAIFVMTFTFICLMSLQSIFKLDYLIFQCKKRAVKKYTLEGTSPIKKF